MKAIFSGVTQIYIRALVQDMVVSVKFLVPDAVFRIAIVNEVFDLAFLCAQCRKVIDNSNHRNHDENHPGTHINDVIQIG